MQSLTRQPVGTRTFKALATSLLLSVAVVSGHASTSDAATLPPATNVLDRVLKRVSQLSRESDKPKYTYEKRSLVEELNAEGETVDSTEKIYHVELIGGWPYTRLVQVKGEKLTQEQINKENQKEQQFRKNVSGRETPRPAQRQPWLTSDLLNKFEFNVVGSEMRNQRKTLVLEFHPKAGNPEKTMQDKIINRFAGRIWVDDEEADIAKMEASLTDELSLGWLGVIGSLKKCEMNLDRQRLEDGTWVNRDQTILLLGRKVFSPMRFKATEESRGFVRAPSQQASPKTLAGTGS